jgi:hypothetical protein
MSRIRVLVELGDGGILGVTATDANVDVIFLDHDAAEQGNHDFYFDGMPVQRLIFPATESELLTQQNADALCNDDVTYIGEPPDEEMLEEEA